MQPKETNMTPIRVFDNAVAGQLRRIVFAAALLGLAAGPFLGQSAEDLRITVGKSIVIDYPADIRQISTSNPEIVDASPVTTREILMSGKGLGSATMVVWSKADQRMFYNVTVELNLEPLRRILQDTFPGEKIEIRPADHQRWIAQTKCLGVRLGGSYETAFRIFEVDIIWCGIK